MVSVVAPRFDLLRDHGNENIKYFIEARRGAGAQASDFQRDRLWVRSPLEKIKLNFPP